MYFDDADGEAVKSDAQKTWINGGAIVMPEGWEFSETGTTAWMYIFVYALNFDSFVLLLRQVLERLRVTDLRFKDEKCEIGLPEATVFGNVLSSSGMSEECSGSIGNPFPSVE